MRPTRSLVACCDAYGQTIPLATETREQNAMNAGSSALIERAVGDVLISALDSAGQRCSVSRVLCLHDDSAGRVVRMLHGALAELQIGKPTQSVVV